MPKSIKGLVLAFTTALLLTLFVPIFFSTLSINFFIPPLIMLLYIGSAPSIGWISFLIGIFLDCVLCMPRIGFLGLSYFIASASLYPKRLFFFKDSFSTLPLLSYFFSVSSTFIQGFLCLLLDLPTQTFSFVWILSDCLLSPILDVVYAMLFFSLPHFFVTQYYGKINVERDESAYEDA